MPAAAGRSPAREDCPGTPSLDGVPGWILSRVPEAAAGRRAACPPLVSGTGVGRRPRAADAPCPLVVRGRGRRPDAPDRARPAYPDRLLDVLRYAGCLDPGTRVVDLAAGTGGLSHQLARVTARCVAVEPSASMRGAFRERVPEVPVLAGSTEAIPVATAGADLVTVAQAFHWFDARRSLGEIARVLRPDGFVALVWTERDESVPWMAELGRLMRSAGDAPYSRALDYLPVLARSPHLADVGRETVSFAEQVDRWGLVDLVVSRRCVNVLAPAERSALLRRVADVAASLPEPIAVPYRTEVLLARTAGAG
jgi:SAM-dependent methyltransferase